MLKKQWRKYWQNNQSIYPDRKQYRLFVFTLIVGLLVSIAGLRVFLELTEALREQLLDDWDTKVSIWIHQLRAPRLTEFMIAITQFGDIYAYIVFIVVITWYAHKKEKGWSISLQITAVLGTTALLNFILKYFIDRGRPDGVSIIDAVGLSFPSGHTMSSIAFYGFIIYLIWMHIKHTGLRIFLTIILITLVLLIGFTRVYLGVHFPSDVLAGYAAGLGWLAICIWVFNWLNHYKLRRLKSNI